MIISAEFSEWMRAQGYSCKWGVSWHKAGALAPHDLITQKIREFNALKS